MQVCKAWRAAVQHSCAGVTELKVYLPADESKVLAILANLGSWVTKYAGLVSSISILQHHSILVQRPNAQELYHVVVSRLLEQSLQQAAASVSAPNQTQSTSSGVPGQRVWRLQSFRYNKHITPAMISALPAASRTTLDLDSRLAVPPAIAGPLQQLTKLRHLVLNPYDSYNWMPTNILAVLSNLHNLTHLEVGNTAVADLCHLPKGLQRLEMCMTSGRVDLGHLTRLKELELSSRKVVDASSVLPAQLERLELNSGDLESNPNYIAHLGISRLQHLTYLDIYETVVDAGQLLSLTALAKLQELHLCKQDNTMVENTSAVWPSLTMLKTLQLHLYPNDPTTALAELVVSAAGKVTGLTCLYLTIEWTWYARRDLEQQVSGVVPMKVCEHLRGLSQLQDLHVKLCPVLNVGMVAPSGALHLSALTALTQLCAELPGGPPVSSHAPVDESITSVIAAHLTKLQRLQYTIEWPDCDNSSPVHVVSSWPMS